MAQGGIKVSFIIPVYNAADYLEECLNSISDLTEQDFEAIVIDDGSTDDSLSILEKHAAKDPRFIVISKENEGASKTRNKGIDMARGEFICFVDADDYVFPNILQILTGAIGDADVCIGQKIRWNQIKDFKRQDSWKGFTGTPAELKPVLYRYKRSMRGATGRLYRTSVVRANNVRFDESRLYAEDMHFNYDYFCFCKKVVFAEGPVYMYRIHNPESLSSQNAPFFLKQWKMEEDCIRKLYN